MEGSMEKGRERREEIGGGFLLNTLTFIFTLQHTYAGFLAKVHTVWFVHIGIRECSTSSPRGGKKKKRTQ